MAPVTAPKYRATGEGTSQIDVITATGTYVLPYWATCIEVIMYGAGAVVAVAAAVRLVQTGAVELVVELAVSSSVRFLRASFPAAL